MQSTMTQVTTSGSLQEALSSALKTVESGEHEVTRIEHQDRQLDEEEQWTQREVDQLCGQLDEILQQQAHLEQQRKHILAQLREIDRQRQKIHGRRKQLNKVRTAVSQRRLESEQNQQFEESLRQARFLRESSTAPDSVADLRQHPRISVEVPVSLHTEHNFYAGISRNISCGGLFVATYEPIPIGTVLEMAVHLANGSTLQLKGKVTWQREYSRFTSDVSPGVGIQFIDLGEKDRQDIEAFMSNREPLLYEEP